MTKDFLLELGLEEMPAHVVTPAEQQLVQRISDYLTENNLAHGQIEQFSTPRRLVVLIHDVADKQPDEDVAVKGPAKKIAQDSEGNWSKAAQGFVRGQKLSTDNIYFQELKGVEYVYVKKHTPGRLAAEILAGLTQPLSEMTFPTRMRWNKFDFEYIRPFHWLVALLDHQVVDMQLLNVKSGNQTRGHRFLGTKIITLSQAADYQQALANDFVIVDANKRKQLIQEQIQALATEHNWLIDIDDDLLEEVTNLVEYPTAFAGQFDEKYLKIPEEVLITSMKDNQRYFDVRTADGKLAPYFIGVRNGNQEHLANVIAGNEKVLVARLEDAAFFFEEDQKHSLDECVARLKQVAFHDKIGSMSEKMQRTRIIADLLAQKFELSDQERQDLLRAADIYKFDLVTEMVGEFAELQGVMGEKYALIFGERPAVAQAIREHYQPISADGSLPQSKVGQVLSIADKIESLMSFFAVDLIPTGSNDPYGLRRQATGIVRILDQENWSLDFYKLQYLIMEQYHQLLADNHFDYQAHLGQVDEFLVERVRQFLSQKQLPHDIILTATSVSTINPVKMMQTAQILAQHQADAHYKEQMEALTRVLRIVKKQSVANPVVDTTYFQHPSEQKLFDAVNELQTNFARQTIEQNYQALVALQPVITAYFDENMIMDKNERVKQNRLSQLQLLADLINNLADLNQLVIK
ncbi:glycine--tRNA ligase subunit beta [Bombilactobacillus folatiphilus]|uniref:Glycine--tRNA ligase beta subunit n=1 Tax=Bombilactobacillus folatiphilus TaxID=2923362 RepID=A0ABY4P7D2_9LACO|nr:glycine--tRNA ligase subunit beta [Bombilactobacillus folatiphilus]UQS81525.1 glycine--tRNA ligase subunit beta [Bombilactobacillus folatiphilus]